MKKLLLILLACLPGCIFVVPRSDARWDGWHDGHNIIRVTCQSSLSYCRETTVELVTQKCGSPIWSVVMATESHGTSQYWAECGH